MWFTDEAIAAAAEERVSQVEAEIKRRDGQAARQARRQAVEDRPLPERDPGDAVPAGVAVQEAGSLAEEDRRVLEHLNEELSPD